MRFLGALIAVIGLTLGYFLGYKEMTINEMRTRLAQLTNLPGLAPPATSSSTSNSSGSGTNSSPSKGGTDPSGRPFNSRGNLGNL